MGMAAYIEAEFGDDEDIVVHLLNGEILTGGVMHGSVSAGIVKVFVDSSNSSSTKHIREEAIAYVTR